MNLRRAKTRGDISLKNNRIAIKLMSPDDVEMKNRFYSCARRLKLTLEREIKFVSTVGDDSPHQVGQVASLTEIDDVIWVRLVSNEDIMPCKALIKLAAEQSELDDQVLVFVNPGPMLNNVEVATSLS